MASYFLFTSQVSTAHLLRKLRYDSFRVLFFLHLRVVNPSSLNIFRLPFFCENKSSLLGNMSVMKLYFILFSRDRIQCSDSGSPRLSVSHMKGYVSRSSSLGSQPDPSPSSDDYLSSSWESRHSATGIDADVWTTARGGSRSFSECE